MHRKWQIYVGIFIILIGLMSLAGAVFDVDLGVFCVPLGLVALGVWLLLRPRLVGPDKALRLRLLGDVRRRGDWQVADEEIGVIIGNVTLDLSSADVPVGEAKIRVFGFVGEVRLIVPEGVGVSISSSSFVTDSRIFGRKRDGIFYPVTFASGGYETAERKVQLETMHFVVNLRVRRP
jgi:predicted membrane protein